MAGFRKAKPVQGAIKEALYGPAGSGKTLTALLMAEGLADLVGKRIAYVDTERGTDFYAKRVSERAIHPEPFDFDAIYSRALSEVSPAIEALSPDEHCVVVLDSVSHFWEGAIETYQGNRGAGGQIPMHAWGDIKRPYKALIAYLMNSPFHVFICGRQKYIFGEDEDTGETKMLGYGMKAEGETAYEPHICVRMIRTHGTTKRLAPVEAFFEKDRTGIMSGRTVVLPPDQEPGYTFEKMAKPFLEVLGGLHGHTETSEEAALKDQEAQLQEKREKAEFSANTRKELEAKMSLAKSPDELTAISKEITPALKKKMNTKDVAAVRDSYKQYASKLDKGAS